MTNHVQKDKLRKSQSLAYKRGRAKATGKTVHNPLKKKQKKEKHMKPELD